MVRKIARRCSKGYKRDESFQTRFERHIQKTETCWIWKGAISGTRGYGQIGFEGRRLYAHRASFEIYKGEIPEGLLICHECDNPSCVNPEHLFLGTYKDNMQDCSKKGRMRQEEKIGWSVLKTEDVILIRELHKTGKYSFPQLAKRFGVHTITIFDVVKKRNWKHI